MLTYISHEERFIAKLIEKIKIASGVLLSKKLFSKKNIFKTGKDVQYLFIT